MKIKKASKLKKRGPAEERLALAGDWRTNIGKAIRKPRPVGGWPAKPKRAKKA